MGPNISEILCSELIKLRPKGSICLNYVCEFVALARENSDVNSQSPHPDGRHHTLRTTSTLFSWPHLPTYLQGCRKLEQFMPDGIF